MRDTVDLIIVSGLSGSGRSVALQSLEDIGYYCVDNLSATLLKNFIAELPKHLVAGAFHGAAVSVDSRNEFFSSETENSLEIIKQYGKKYRIVFLETEQDKLIARYSETRRKHPLTHHGLNLVAAIQKERELLAPLKNKADKIFDTTDKTPHELRAQIRDFVGAGLSKSPHILVESFGFKYGIPREADFIFDVRCLPNPHWDETLRSFNGLDEVVQQFLQGCDEVQDMIQDIFAFLHKWLSGFVSESRSYITVAVGCTGGQHRSVYICEQIKALLKDNNITTQIRHRELEK